MRIRAAGCLRKHIPCLIIVPLVVITMTWPAFARVFDADTFWVHTDSPGDVWQKIWDAWHLGRVLEGRAELFYTDAMFHPAGLSLAFHGASMPHAFLLHALKPLLPIDDAYNLLYLLTLCFNAFCAYALIYRLFADKWIALYGAVVVGVNVWFTNYLSAPDLLMVGTLPLSLYFLHRSVMERRWRFSALAGICAGFTALIGIYAFMFLLISVAVYALFLALSHWRQPRFWLGLLLLLAICVPIAWFRIYPFFVDAALLEEGLEFHDRCCIVRDLLEFLVLPANPITGEFLSIDRR